LFPHPIRTFMCTLCGWGAGGSPVHRRRSKDRCVGGGIVWKIRRRRGRQVVGQVHRVPVQSITTGK
jgi:hypothetical protein